MAFLLKTQILILEETLFGKSSSIFHAWKFSKLYVLGKNVEKMSILS